MIVDFHTHIFPPDIVGAREDYCRSDRLFGALYFEPKAKLATAEELLTSMDRAGIDFSVVLGFAWSSAEVCRRHNDYLLEAASNSSGRLLPFCTLEPASGLAAITTEIDRCVAGGARGFGELRPDDQGYRLDSEAGTVLAEAAIEHKVVLLFHVSEPVGHSYPGKDGLSIAAFARFAAANPEARVVGAHWGGGLPFYALMPEIADAFKNTRVDTAASRFLYRPQVFPIASRLIGASKVLFGSDFPLISQGTARRDVEESGLDSSEIELVLGRNAGELLGLL